jgi:hypothetical protein
MTFNHLHDGQGGFEQELLSAPERWEPLSWGGSPREEPSNLGRNQICERARPRAPYYLRTPMVVHF